MTFICLASPPGPLVKGDGGEDRLRSGAAKLRQQTDRAIIGLFGGNLLEMGQFLYRNDNFLMLMAGEPKRAHAFLDRIVEIALWDRSDYVRKQAQSAAEDLATFLQWEFEGPAS